LLTFDLVIGPPRSLQNIKWPSVCLRNSPKGPKLIALKRMHAGDPALQPPNVDMGSAEIDLIPFEINRLADPEPMPSHD
jgi:hypothetical protein